MKNNMTRSSQINFPVSDEEKRIIDRAISLLSVNLDNKFTRKDGLVYLCSRYIEENGLTENKTGVDNG